MAQANRGVGAAKATKVQLKVKLGSARDIPILYANQIIVNFTGDEFLVTVVAATTEPWIAGKPPVEAEGRILARFAFSPAHWLAIASSFEVQIEALRDAGQVTEEMLAQARGAVVTE